MMLLWLLAIFSPLVNAVDIIGVQPAVPNYGTPVQSFTVLQHKFGNSYGSPASANLAAFTGDLSHVQLELQLSSSGVQFDRLIHIYLNGVELWRPSTPEPGNKQISANMTKDVSHFVSLFKQGGTLTFQLDNVQDSTYTGAFEVTLIANYYSGSSSDKTEQQWYYDTQPSAVTALTAQLVEAPPDVSFTVTQVEKTAYRIGLQIFASGNSDEEFYYTNSQSSSGPTRLIEVWVGSTLAGVVDPFQPIYTGGMQPSLWTPIVGVNTYDVPSYYVDISAFLPSLWQGTETVTLKIVNGYSGTSVRSNWLLNAALLSWTDSSKQGTGGEITEASNTSSTPVLLSGAYNSGNVSYIGLQNTVTVKANLEFSDSSTQSVGWTQSSTAINAQYIGGGSDPQMYVNYAHGSSQFTSGSTTLSRTHTYPMALYFGSGNSIAIDQSYIVSNSGSSSGTSSVNNNILASWGTSDTTKATCGWTDGGSWVRTAQATSNNLDSDNTSGGSASFGGSWSSNMQTLSSASGDANSLGSALAAMASTYSSGGMQDLSARDADDVYFSRTFHRN